MNHGIKGYIDWPRMFSALWFASFPGDRRRMVFASGDRRFLPACTSCETKHQASTGCPRSQSPYRNMPSAEDRPRDERMAGRGKEMARFPGKCAHPRGRRRSTRRVTASAENCQGGSKRVDGGSSRHRGGRRPGGIKRTGSGPGRTSPCSGRCSSPRCLHWTGGTTGNSARATRARSRTIESPRPPGR